jgi:tripartite-type tricarboxylate transporter receptor subunit TctC
MFRAATSADIVHVPYRGTGPALNDVVAGVISGAFTTTLSAEGVIQSKQVKVLGVAGPKRMDVIPGVPTFQEVGITGADAELWIGVAAPAATPREIVALLNREINRILDQEDTRARFKEWELQAALKSPEEFQQVVADEVNRIRQLISSGALSVQ